MTSRTHHGDTKGPGKQCLVKVLTLCLQLYTILHPGGDACYAVHVML